MGGRGGEDVEVKGEEEGLRGLEEALVEDLGGR